MAIPTKSSAHKKKTNCILLVDDDPIANYLHLKLLNDLKIAERIDIVTNGEEALHYIKNVCHPEIMFLDINMPVMDGIEFLKEYCSISPQPETDIVILTTSEHITDLETVKKYGVRHYMNKPLTEKQLLKVV